ncbi:MAG: hypothetical protein A2339_04080 [Elusimicrobia bacterium RIFOXYB12_FULL_50_12]|nr:MAG: hypothetical protein A2386_07130 [Elusimicrobia bacterium RIFOXYB1_FULL_48_9]OGS16711.1 MAG: hypothetical protein A2251_00825 [Elusimicrobia bacterium RIFOXYA2_FULL_47_53]OGS26764.1 MAG: hypothetical protein A2339_04080 [Elusimicrobia bacterium RIFOXYB12_FULL_50_12]OGS31670.1 MAG: hypothetical protein A2323_05655 [Elusimicrobia bacterium RIFOXYB2_FULL_46_23]
MAGTYAVISFSAEREIIASNFALALAAEAKTKTVYIDFFSREDNSTETLFGFKPSKTLGELIKTVPKIDPELLNGYLPEHSSGLAIAAGYTPGENEDFAAIAPLFLNSISSAYPNIVFSLQAENYTAHPELINNSDVALIFCEPQAMALSKAGAYIDYLKSHLYGEERIKIILLRQKSLSYIKNESASRFLSVKIFSEAQYNPEVFVTAINNSKPVVLSDPRDIFSASLKNIAKSLLELNLKQPRETTARTAAEFSDAKEPAADMAALKESIHSDLIKTIGAGSGVFDDKSEETKNRIRSVLKELVSKYAGAFPVEKRQKLLEEVYNEALGLGCLEDLLKDNDVTEIMVNGADKIYVEKKGKIQLSAQAFSSDSRLRTIIDRIVTPLGRRVDEASPLVDARLSDGSRVNVIIPPIALNGSAITIRKFSKNKLSIEDLIKFGALNGIMADFLKTCVLLRKNIVISGGTGSGKTTLLNVVSSFIPPDERIVTIEDSAELKLPQEHVVRLESRPPSVEGSGEVSIRRLVINALRMRPDRIVVGECRSGETLDMLQAMNTGHDGSLTTIHSNSPKDGIGRITTMAMMSGTELPEKAIREQIAAAVHLIVQLTRLSDGSRKIVDISEIAGIKNDSVVIIPIFKFEQTGVKDGKVEGKFKATGNIPTFFEEIEKHGLSLSKTIFQQ